MVLGRGVADRLIGQLQVVVQLDGLASGVDALARYRFTVAEQEVLRPVTGGGPYQAVQAVEVLRADLAGGQLHIRRGHHQAGRQVFGRVFGVGAGEQGFIRLSIM